MINEENLQSQDAEERDARGSSNDRAAASPSLEVFLTPAARLALADSIFLRGDPAEGDHAIQLYASGLSDIRSSSGYIPVEDLDHLTNLLCLLNERADYPSAVRWAKELELCLRGNEVAVKIGTLLDAYHAVINIYSAVTDESNRRRACQDFLQHAAARLAPGPHDEHEDTLRDIVDSCQGVKEGCDRMRYVTETLQAMRWNNELRSRGRGA